MNFSTFSIIIPAYNEEIYLPPCLASVAELDYPKDLIELIVVDNGSDDKTCEIAVSSGAKLLCDPHLSIAGLRNLGAAHSTGAILAFLDADCTVSKHWLRNAVIYAAQTDIVAWGAPPSIPEPSTWVQRTWYLVRQSRYFQSDVDWLESMNLFVRREDFFSVNAFNIRLHTCEDVDLCYRLAKRGRIFLDTRIQVVHHGEASTVGQFFSKEIWRGRSNVKGILSHGFSWKELPSLSIPLYFVTSTATLLSLLVISFPSFPWLLATSFYLFPTIAVFFKLKNKPIPRRALLGLFLLLQLYFVARTIGTFKRW
jgi:glycosyltransferase involved in cell wall biosynthesis